MATLWSEDVSRPAVSTPLVGFDNYEIYDLVWPNATATSETYSYYPTVEKHAYVNQITREDYFPVGTNPPRSLTLPPDPLSNEAALFQGAVTYTNGVPNLYWTLYEGYQESIENIPEKLNLDTSTTSKISPKGYAVQRYTPDGASNTGIIYTLMDEYKPLPSSGKISWDKLIIKDDIEYSGIAAVDGVFEFEYWSNNYLEAHPSIEFTLDYRKEKVRLIKGKKFSFKLWHPVAHTLVIPVELIGATARGKPLIIDLLVSNRRYASSLTAPPIPIFSPPSGQIFVSYGKSFVNPFTSYNPLTGQVIGLRPTIGWFAPNNPPEVSRYQFTSCSWLDYRVLRATNRVAPSIWGVDAVTGDYPNISTAELNQYHFDPQSDTSNGTIIMDSIRTIQTLQLAQQIADAIDAATYATDPATGAPRVANLGHLVEKVANFIGYRPEPDGSIDIEKEKTIYASAVVKDDFVGGSDYYAGRFGKKGLYTRRAPNKRGATGKWEPGGIVKIHDLPQLHTEIFGQLNQALNLQDSTSITIRDGANTYEYPNQLALLIEIGTGVIQHRRQIREIWASSIVTQKTVNEVLAGFGLPVVSKALAINGQQLPYWGIQPNQSLQKEIATSTYQGGAQLGQLL